MKLRYNTRGWEQLQADRTANLPALAVDEFTYSRDFKEIMFPCRGAKPFSNCIMRIRRGEPDPTAVIHGWDGNIEAPTITPSIGCDHRCGWHGNITKGEINP